MTCKYCKALAFPGEVFPGTKGGHLGRLCCNQGQISLTKLPKAPPQLEKLYQGNTSLSKVRISKLYKHLIKQIKIQKNNNSTKIQRNFSFKIKITKIKIRFIHFCS